MNEMRIGGRISLDNAFQLRVRTGEGLPHADAFLHWWRIGVAVSSS